VQQITGDITDSAVADRVLSLFRDGEAERLADLVVCDGAPDVTGACSLRTLPSAERFLGVGREGAQWEEFGCRL
jgi:23S rRNA U2552 (ribose-2'-O)-methylase RlmE/FtsJ